MLTFFSNIFLTNDDHIKIGNLAFSRSIDEDSTSMISTYAGTYKYTSPEIRDGKKYSFKTDVWSAGCIAFELITLTSLYELTEGNGCDLKRLIDSLNTTDSLKSYIRR
jgi:serine/threonine protein kinase